MLDGKTTRSSIRVISLQKIDMGTIGFLGLS